MTRWVVLAAPVLVSGLAAWWVSTRRYRYADDVVHRRIWPWLLPVVVAVAAVLAAPFFSGRPLLVIATYALALVWGATLAFIDFEVRRLPDLLTLPAYPVLGLLLTVSAALAGDWTPLLRAAASAGLSVAAFAAVFLVAELWAAGSGGLGLGDVKIAGTLGALLGWFGGLNVLFGFATGFLVGAVIAVVLLVVRRADRRSHLSLGPSLLVGAYIWCVLPLPG